MPAEKSRQMAAKTAKRERYQTAYNRQRYVQGSAALQPEVRRELEAPKKQLSHSTRKNRDKARHMNFAYVLFLAVMMMVTGFVLIGYIRLESSITASVKNISKLESQLNNLKLENDEMLGRIESAVNLEEIRRIAITELGMTYAQEGQIVEIPDEGSDYVRQFTKVGK